MGRGREPKKGSTMSKRAKRSAGDLSGMPHSRCKAACEGVPVSPPEIKQRRMAFFCFLIENFRVLWYNALIQRTTLGRLFLLPATAGVFYGE